MSMTAILLLVVQANVMMEYSIDEALSLLTKNLASAKKTLSQVQEDLNFIRDQTTTTEVSILNDAHHGDVNCTYVQFSKDVNFRSKFSHFISTKVKSWWCVSHNLSAYEMTALLESISCFC